MKYIAGVELILDGKLYKKGSIIEDPPYVIIGMGRIRDDEEVQSDIEPDIEPDIQPDVEKQTPLLNNKSVIQILDDDDKILIEDSSFVDVGITEE